MHGRNSRCQGPASDAAAGKTLRNGRRFPSSSLLPLVSAPLNSHPRTTDPAATATPPPKPMGRARNSFNRNALGKWAAADISRATSTAQPPGRIGRNHWMKAVTGAFARQQWQTQGGGNNPNPRHDCGQPDGRFRHLCMACDANPCLPTSVAPKLPGLMPAGPKGDGAQSGIGDRLPRAARRVRKNRRPRPSMPNRPEHGRVHRCGLPPLVPVAEAVGVLKNVGPVVDHPEMLELEG